MKLIVDNFRRTVSDEDMQDVLDMLVQWCDHDYGHGHKCRKHGVIRHIDKETTDTVAQTLRYYFGATPNKGAWWRKHSDDDWSVEFCDYTAVAPPPRRPWEWCGVSLLFEEQHQQELAYDHRQMVAASHFTLGDRVWFVHKRHRIDGTYAGGRKRATVIVAGGKWYVPFDELNRA